MIPALIFLVIVLTGAASAALGLWWGERQARQQAVNWLQYERVDGKGRAEVIETSGDPVEQAEKKEWEQTVSKLEDSLRSDLKRQGRLGSVSDKDIHEEAERIASEMGGWRFDLP